MVLLFSIFMWNYKFGDTPDRVEAVVLAIRSKHKDAVYLNCLMAAAYEQGLFDRGSFIPYGIQIKEGLDFLKNLLWEHNNYIKNIKCIALEGISENTMWTVAPLPSNNKAYIADHVALEEHSIESMERTQLTVEK
eukprot:9889380-Ditylum_brightwellii.AAC.1